MNSKIFAFAFSCLLWTSLSVFAQQPSLGDAVQEAVATAGDKDDELPTLEELEVKRAAVTDEIRALGGRVSPSGVISFPAGEDGATPAGKIVAEPAQALMTRIDAQTAALQNLEKLRLEKEDLDLRKAAGPQGRLPAGPLDLGDLDTILDERDVARTAVELAESEAEAADRGVEDAEERLAALERRSRVEASEGGSSEEARRRLRWQIRVVREELVLEGLRREVASRSAELQRQTAAYLDSAAEKARDLLQADEEGLEKRLRALEERIRDEREKLSDLEENLDEAHRLWMRSQEVEGPLQEEAAAEASYRRAHLEILEDERQIRLGRLELASLEEELWRLRYAAAGIDVQAGRDERIRRLEEVQADLDRLSRDARRRVEELGAARRLYVDRERRAGSASDDWIVQEQEARRNAESLAVAYGAEVAAVAALAVRTLAETRTEEVHFREVADRGLRSLRQAWQFQVMEVEDRPITLGKILLALLLMAIGYGVSRRLSRSISRVLSERFHVSRGTASALQNLVFYLSVVFFFLWGFQLVGIPLTVFTLLGGVIAIGVGFGSQNVVNNFISGLILLVERPIKVGDLIDVDGVLGIVERIGLRSTRVRAGNNTHIFVPNSSFLEKNVLNWTGSDDLVRSFVDVGVAYGSPVAEVKKLMTEALEKEPGVLKQPPSEVLFMEFGDNALLFRSYFWHRMSQGLDATRAQSALRFRLDQVLGDAGIVIAFPQRDVHLDTLSPLQVQLSRLPEDAGGGEKQGDAKAEPSATETEGEADREDPGEGNR